jgi:hypothetical protein
MIPIATPITPIKMAINCGFSTRRRMMASGRLKPTTDIMNAKTVPSDAPLSSRALTMGITPAALEYSGMPTSTEAGTLHQAPLAHDACQRILRDVAVNERANANTDDDEPEYLADNFLCAIP